MSEIDSILTAWRALSGPNRDAVLATVVHVTGSAYRRPGARMLLIPDGRRIGTISGGCLEGDIARKAWWCTANEVPELRVYDTTSDDDAVWEFGLGCNGVVHVLLERVASTQVTQMLDFLERQRQLTRPAVVATVVRATAASGVAVGDRLFGSESESLSGDLAATSTGQELVPYVFDAFQSKRSALVRLRECEVFVEFVGRPISLVIFGAGQDAVPLVEIASMTMGWGTTVADGRPAYARPERFPGASRVIAMSPRALLSGIEITPETAVVLMTHNYPMDRRLLPLILERKPRYVGILGPKNRSARLFDELGMEMPGCVAAPAGLDLGGDAPASIALAIASEIQACVAQRTGGMLRLRREAIHEPAITLGGPAPQVAEQGERPAYCETTVGSYV